MMATGGGAWWDAAPPPPDTMLEPSPEVAVLSAQCELLRDEVLGLRTELDAIRAVIGPILPDLEAMVDMHRVRLAEIEGARLAKRLEEEQQRLEEERRQELERLADRGQHAAEELYTTMEIERQRAAEARTYECVICLGESTLEELYIIDGCGHRFCCSCLHAHIKINVRESETATVTCPARLEDGTPCPSLIDFPQIEQVLCRENDPESEEITALFSSRKFDEMMRNDPIYSRCPAIVGEPRAPCNGWGMRANETTQNAECLRCHHKYCSSCHADAHSGTCEAYAETLRAQGRDGGAAAYQQLRSSQGYRTCSQCGNDVEKNGGCDHMTCRCGYEFCYVCEGPYRRCSCT